MADTCGDESIKCSLFRIAEAASGDWSWVDWLVTVGLPLAGIAASVFIGIASLRLTGAANRISQRAAEIETEREARDGRTRFVGHLLEWADVVWSDEKGVKHAEAQVQAALRLRASSLSEPGVDLDAARAIVEAAQEARQVVEAMPLIERRALGSSVKSAIATLGHMYLALPGDVEAGLSEFRRRVTGLKEQAAAGRARGDLREVLRSSPRPDGQPRSETEIEELLDGFEASLGDEV